MSEDALSTWVHILRIAKLLKPGGENKIKSKVSWTNVATFANNYRDDMSDFMKYIGGSTAGAVTLGAVTATAAAWYYMSRSPAPHFPVDLNNQTKRSFRYVFY